MANRDLLYIGISGDGDTASIGMGQFAHALRRVPLEEVRRTNSMLRAPDLQTFLAMRGG